jgi:hypothetical protein
MVFCHPLKRAQKYIVAAIPEFCFAPRGTIPAVRFADLLASLRYQEFIIESAELHRVNQPAVDICSVSQLR